MEIYCRIILFLYLITTNPQSTRLKSGCFVLIIRASVAWMAAAEPQGWVYGVPYNRHGTTPGCKAEFRW